jgi:hypothetical protein
LVAILLFAPHLAWQSVHGWPALEFMRNATGYKMQPVSPLGFLRDQFAVMGFANVLVYLPGLCYGLFARGGRPWRIFSVLFLSVAALLIAAGTSRANYLAVAYPPLFALGGLAWEGWTAGRLRWVRESFLALLVVVALPWIPFSLPVLPVDLYVRYQTLMGGKPSTEERKRVGPLPQSYADMFGWPELAGEVAEGDVIDVVAQLRSRRFGGIESLQLEIRDAAASGHHAEARAILESLAVAVGPGVALGVATA